MPREAGALNHARLSIGSGSQAPMKYQRPLAQASTQAWLSSVWAQRGGVDLTRGDADGAEGGDCESRLLAAASDGLTDSAQRAARAGVGGLVGGFLVTPVVDFKYGFLHRETSDTLFQLLVEHGAGEVEVFIVDADGEDEMAKFALGHRFAPGHFLAGAERRAHVFEVKFRSVAAAVGENHVGVEKLHGVALGRSKCGLRLQPFFRGLSAWSDCIGLCACL